MGELSDYVESGLQEISAGRYAQFHSDQQDRIGWYKNVGERIVDCHILSIEAGPMEEEFMELYATFEHLRGHFTLEVDPRDEIEVDTYRDIAARQLTEMRESLRKLGD